MYNTTKYLEDMIKKDGPPVRVGEWYESAYSSKHSIDFMGSGGDGC